MSHKAANPTPASSSKSSPPTLLDSPVAIDHNSHKPVGSRSQPIELSEEEEKENYFEEDEEVESYDQYSDDDVNDFDDDFDDFDEDASMGVEEEEEDDDYYEFLDKLKKPKIYETEFEVLSPKDLHKMEKDTIAHVSGFLSVTEAQAHDHMPATCKIAKAWLKKCQDDSETANWISANTKECAKCHSTIEKSGGCNHMTCQKCKHEFCWICMGDWSLHGTSYYNCSRYDEADSMAARSEQDKSRSQLKRYLHYYNRYMNHLDSLKRDSETFEQMQEKMKELQESAGMSWIEVQFLSQAFEVLSASRHTMTWTYAFAYYLQKTHRTVIFEDNQNDLEVAVEQLSELFERPAMDLALLKINLLDKCQYVASRRVVLLEDVAQGLLDDAWKYNVSF
ncbi:hypothetical protein DV495_001939 [Geotrichum candidum]|nr:hypothetical protein DV454_003803 [Geotrichum candidum]KAI9214737.1 hypothetical protein DS838_000384 [Geotrichum bryndzae]KAF5122967.1 hypothetical protein DV452_000428 [Geotrichum candidum]KAF5131840.1 hypothetical protein DV495_001939 [Geotrichum candidum]KAF7499073.1 hypothetical protein DV113_002886 [Geotrichum candidum]